VGLHRRQAARPRSVRLHRAACQRAAFGRFAEAILHFQSNASDEQKAQAWRAHERSSSCALFSCVAGCLQVSVASFESDFTAAYDVILTKWLLTTKEAKARCCIVVLLLALTRGMQVRFAIMESLGYMANRISKAALEAKLPVVRRPVVAASSLTPDCATAAAAVHHDVQEGEGDGPPVHLAGPVRHP
jgi:hypothetical protein